MDNSSVLTEEQSKMLKNMGSLGYLPKKISLIMPEFTETFLTLELKRADSPIKKVYEEGSNFADYLLDLKLFEMARAGDIKALEKLEQRKRTRT